MKIKNKKYCQWEEQFEDLEVWLLDKGYTLTVAHDVEDCLYLEDKIVCIQSRSLPETRYYSLLHECGHILVADGSKQWKKDMPLYAQEDGILNDGRRRRGKAYKVSLIAEEVEAWKRGRRMSGKKGHHIDNEKYNKLFSLCVFEHIKCVISPVDYEE
jgi:hypothetical protein